jgi:lipopolysaccharide export system protein LptA
MMHESQPPCFGDRAASLHFGWRRGSTASCALRRGRGGAGSVADSPLPATLVRRGGRRLLHRKAAKIWCKQRPHGVRGCRDRLIERRLNAVRECSAPQSRDVPLRIADYCIAAMLVLGMLGAAAAQNKVQGALQGQNNGQPVHIEAMTLEIRDKDKTATFSGNVKVVQGDTTMRCRTLVVFYGPEEGAGATKAAAAPTSTESQAAPGMPQGGSIRRAEARGDVTVVSKDQNASGDLGVYDMKKKTITLTGNVVVSQGKNVLHGERVVVDTVTGDARIDSGVAAHDGVGSGVTPRDRVRVLIVPGKDTKGAPTNTMSFEAPSHPH